MSGERERKSLEKKGKKKRKDCTTKTKLLLGVWLNTTQPVNLLQTNRKGKRTIERRKPLERNKLWTVRAERTPTSPETNAGQMHARRLWKSKDVSNKCQYPVGAHN